jgi:hypothetical protein
MIRRRIWRADPDFLREHGAELDPVEAGCLRRLARLSVAVGDVATAKEALHTIRALAGQGRAADALLWAAARLPGARAAVNAVKRLRSMRKAHARDAADRV